MKKFIFGALILLSGVVFGQDKTDVKAVCSKYENGNIKETGLLKGDKLHGDWVKYSQEGDALIVGTYNEGEKVGDWLFVDEVKGTIREITFENNKVVKSKIYIHKTPTSLVSYKR